MNPERYCPPKELGSKLDELGLGYYTYQYCKAIAVAMKQQGFTVIRRFWVRPTDAVAFLEKNPDFEPFKGKKRGQKASA